MTDPETLAIRHATILHLRATLLREVEGMKEWAGEEAMEALGAVEALIKKVCV